MTRLLRADGEDGEVYAVELVEAAPEAALREPFVYFPHALVVHLVGAVEDHNVLAQSVAQILRKCEGMTQLMTSCETPNLRLSKKIASTNGKDTSSLQR